VVALSVFIGIIFVLTLFGQQRGPLWDAIIELKSSVEALQATVSTLQAQMGDANVDIGDLETRMGTAEGNISALQGDLTTASNSIMDLQIDVSDILGRLTTAEGDITALQDDMSTAIGDISDLENRMDDAETAIENQKLVYAYAYADNFHYSGDPDTWTDIEGLSTTITLEKDSHVMIFCGITCWTNANWQVKLRARVDGGLTDPFENVTKPDILGEHMTCYFMDYLLAGTHEIKIQWASGIYTTELGCLRRSMNIIAYPD